MWTGLTLWSILKAHICDLTVLWKEQKEGDLFSKHTLMCLSLLYFWQSIFIKKLLIFPVWWLCLSDRFTVMAAALTRATCLESIVRLSRWNPQWDPKGSLSLYLCTSCCQRRLFLVFGRKQYQTHCTVRLYYSPMLCMTRTLNGFWVYCHIWEDTWGKLMT